MTSQQRGVTVSRCWQSSLSKVGLIARARCLVWWHLTPIPLTLPGLFHQRTHHRGGLPPSLFRSKRARPARPFQSTSIYRNEKIGAPSEGEKKKNDLERVTHLSPLIRITVAHLRYLSTSRLFLTPLSIRKIILSQKVSIEQSQRFRKE